MRAGFEVIRCVAQGHALAVAASVLRYIVSTQTDLTRRALAVLLRPFFASLLGCVAADRLAAVAPVWGGLDLRTCVPVRAVPVLVVYGRADRIVPAEMVHGARDWWARANGCGPAVEREGCTRYTRCAADVVYCEGPQAHRWPRSATARVWRFFQAHPRH